MAMEIVGIFDREWQQRGRPLLATLQGGKSTSASQSKHKLPLTLGLTGRSFRLFLPNIMHLLDMPVF